LNLQDYSTIWNGKKQEKNDTKINYFRRLTKFTFYEIINVAPKENDRGCQISMTCHLGPHFLLTEIPLKKFPNDLPQGKETSRGK
jgi:hypothetical protein